MPPNSTVTAETVLHTLLDRFEDPKDRVRDITYKIDYRRIGGPAAQDDFHRVLRDAAGAGGVELEQDRWGRLTDELARIRLADAEKLYRFLNRSPAATIAMTALSAIEAAVPEIVEEPFFRTLLDEAVASWRANKSFIGLAPAEAETFVTVLRLTHGIIHLDGRDVDHRTFSRRVVKDSKALERWEGRVAHLLKRWNRVLEGDEPREVLEACGIVRRAHLLCVKGPISLASDDIKLEGTGELFLGLPWLSIQRATLSRPVDYIITIENPTSFWRYCLEIRGRYLALLSDGFPARDVLSGMVHLVEEAQADREVSILHWGDIDAGGVRIAAHLEDAFKTPIRLHQMDPALAETLGSPLQSRKGLDRLVSRTGDVGALARWLLTDPAKALEQEELDPRSP